MNLNHYPQKQTSEWTHVQIAILSLQENNVLRKHKVVLRNLTENMELNKGQPLIFF